MDTASAGQRTWLFFRHRPDFFIDAYGIVAPIGCIPFAHEGASDMKVHHGCTALVGSVVIILFSACTFKATTKETTDTTSNITGTTSGRVWWNEDGLVKPEHTIAAFTAYNAQNLEEDLARGQGEYLASLETLIGAEGLPTFHPFAQEAYSRWRRSGSRSADELVRVVRTARRTGE